MTALRPLLHEAIQIELRQIKHLAMLGCMAPDEFCRDIILNMIMEEAGEAKFWNTVAAAYQGVQLTGGDPCHGMPPGMAPMPGWNPNPGCAPYPGTPCPGMPPGMAPISGWNPTPGCDPCPPTPCPAMPIGGGHLPIWNPAPAMNPNPGSPGCGCGKGFYSEEAKEDDKK